jgi:hypothetical protein
MALIVRLSVIRPTYRRLDEVTEHVIEHIEIVNRGRNPQSHPGASDHYAYEVRERLGNGAVGNIVWVSHPRSAAARRLTERALRALRPTRRPMPDHVDAHTWALLRLEQWATEGADQSALISIVDQALEGAVD